MVDDMCFIRRMHTEAINHEPAITYMQTGNQITGRPCLGAWVVLRPRLAQPEPADVRRAASPSPSNTEQVQAISARLWSLGLPARRARRRVASAPAATRSSTSTIPPGVDAEVRRSTLDGLNALNEMNYQQVGDPETHTRIAAVRAGLPHAGERARTDRHLARNPRAPTSSTATTRRSPARFANTALLARRMVERGVRFVQIYHNNWDTHANVAGRLPSQCKDVDQACYGLIQDLKAARPARRDAGHLGRRVRPHDLLAGRPDRRQLRPRPPPALLHDVDGRRRHQGRHRLRRDRRLLATTSSRTRSTSATSTPPCCTSLGFDHERFTYRYQGLDQKLTGVEKATRRQGTAGLSRFPVEARNRGEADPVPRRASVRLPSSAKRAFARDFNSLNWVSVSAMSRQISSWVCSFR